MNINASSGKFSPGQLAEWDQRQRARAPAFRPKSPTQRLREMLNSRRPSPTNLSTSLGCYVGVVYKKKEPRGPRGSYRVTQSLGRRNGAHIEQVLAPQLVRDYHEGMGGVDTHDQKRLQCFSIQKAVRFEKYYHTIFVGLVDIDLINIFIIYSKLFARKYPGKPVPTHGQFMEEMQTTLLAVGPSDFEDDLSIDALFGNPPHAHVPLHLPGTGSNRLKTFGPFTLGTRHSEIGANTLQDKNDQNRGTPKGLITFTAKFDSTSIENAMPPAANGLGSEGDYHGISTDTNLSYDQTLNKHDLYNAHLLEIVHAHKPAPSRWQSSLPQCREDSGKDHRRGGGKGSNKPRENSVEAWKAADKEIQKEEAKYLRPLEVKDIKWTNASDGEGESNGIGSLANSL
ncbi:hypothetical protein ON010_g7709 [Phytophthora cinnamomi]|nr:hypothetical protein ON010_g7709 [Phytophthora cinnamomi]